jgi:tetratricopeptide (TPR) repeat protein
VFYGRSKIEKEITFINLRPVWQRLPLVVVAVLALAGAWSALQWLVGSTMAEHAKEFGTAESAVRLAPRDPYTHLQLARLHRVSFLPEELPKSLSEYELAAALGPNDYQIWTELGRARSASGDDEGGVIALRRAADLAPAYAKPRWHLGNALLRAGRTDEAFAELRRAADADSSLRPQIFNLAWQFYDQDVKRIVEVIGDSPTARAQLTTVLVGRGLINEALALWATLGADEKKSQSGAADTLVRALAERKMYRSTLQVVREAGDVESLPEKVTNGSFESEIAAPGKHIFNWQVITPPGVQIAVDPRVKKEGARSLRLAFNAPSQIDFRGVLQLVPVEAETSYRLSFFTRAEELKSASLPIVEVLDGSSGAGLGASPPLASGSSDWTETTVEFKTPRGAEAVMIRFTRTQCSDAVCPIFGKVWYDDFNLQRAGRGGAH